MTISTVLDTLAGASERGDAIRFWREPRYGGLECLSASFRTYRYVPHTHETYAIAAVVEGCEAFRHRGVRHYATAGSIAVVCPDELHDGEPAGESYSYRTLYPSVTLMRSIAEEVFGRALAAPPRFRASVVEDRDLTARFATTHAMLRDPEVALLARDEALVAVLAALIRRHGDVSGAPAEAGREHLAVARVRDRLDSDLRGGCGLDELAALAGLNRAHLVRVFRRATGLTPHAYLIDRRVRAARRLLAAGGTPADVAADCGFFDQSHLNRVFKARMAVTPGLFRA